MPLQRIDKKKIKTLLIEDNCYINNILSEKIIY